MQNRGSIMLFTLLFAVVCLYQLSFTWIVNGVEDDAYEYAINKAENTKLFKNDSTFNQKDFTENQYKLYLDSVSSENVYNIWVAKYTYNDCKQRQINLGLDLKGGMNVTLEVMVVDVLKALSNNSTDSLFNLALNNSISAQKNSQKDFMTLFSEEYANKLVTGPGRDRNPTPWGIVAHQLPDAPTSVGEDENVRTPLVNLEPLVGWSEQEIEQLRSRVFF